MEKAVVVSKNLKANVYFKELLAKRNFTLIKELSSANAVKRYVFERDIDLVIIVAPLTDEFGDRLARDIVEKGNSQVIFFAKEESLSEINSDLSNSGVVTLSIPINRSSVNNAINICEACYKRMKSVLNESTKLQRRLDDIKRIDYAKCLLIEKEGMKEEEAHKLIERVAMNDRKTKRQVAEEYIQKLKG